MSRISWRDTTRWQLTLLAAIAFMLGLACQGHATPTGESESVVHPGAVKTAEPVPSGQDKETQATVAGDTATDVNEDGFVDLLDLSILAATGDHLNVLFRTGMARGQIGGHLFATTPSGLSVTVKTLPHGEMHRASTKLRVDRP